MKVIVAENRGFCHGVRNAISLAEQLLARGEDVYSLGPIIHNKDMVDRLARAGLKTVDTVDDVPSGTVLIRSHGVAPEQMAKIEKRGLKIADATCVLVKRVQRIVRELGEQGHKVVVIGDEKHPEIRAVVGCAKDVVVAADESDLDKLGRNDKLGIVCQTTQSPEHFGKVVGAIAARDFGELRVINTLCREAVKRQASAVELCKKVDIMFVLGGLNSANTRKLAEMCRKYNAQTFHLQNYSELDTIVLRDKRLAGVTAGASTPEWVIDEFVEKLRAFDCGEQG